MSWERLKDKNLQKRLIQRAKIISLAREFFVANGFLEVETPILVPYAGQEPYLDPMKVKIGTPTLNLPLGEGEKIISSPARGEVGRGGSTQGYLITSPEYSHKKLLSAGFKKTFEITKCFRDGEPNGGLHNPEFTMLEWYRAGSTYYAIMNDSESIIQHVWSGMQNTSPTKSKIKNQKSKINSKFKIPKLKYGSKVIDLSPPWERITVKEAFEKYVGVSDITKLSDRAFLRYLCKQRGYSVSKSDTYEDLFFKIFLTEIEPKLGFPKPTILYEYPACMASLARVAARKQGNKETRKQKIAERFELYIAGIEIANAFSELNDAKEQRQRFLQEQKLRKKLNKEIIPLDEDFLNALEHMPPAAGIALGIDRLVMLLTNAPRVEDALAFPASDIFKNNI